MHAHFERNKSMRNHFVYVESARERFEVFFVLLVVKRNAAAPKPNPNRLRE